MSPVHQFLAETASRALPRILTQICRDPGAPFYGACDRNWWHYKIRDFPSIILQQAGYALAIASDLRGWDYQSQSGWDYQSQSGWDYQSQTVAGTTCPQPPTKTQSTALLSHLTPSATSGRTGPDRALPTALRSLAASTARFWNQRALKHGAFEEYYPYEQGYPPAAFSTLAVAKLCHLGIVPLSDIRPGLAIAAHQLLTRFEAQAANQQIAGTAALAVIRTLAPDLVSESEFKRILTDILALQHDEGWFPEYDGPDLGYLAVSIDCLYDIHDHTQDPRILPAIRKAADYIAWFALSPLGAAGMHNSRNTDYFTPYGLVRLALEEQDPRTTATVAAVFNRQAQGVWRQESGDRSQEAGDRGQRSEGRDQRSEDGDQETGGRRQESEIRDQRSEVGEHDSEIKYHQSSIINHQSISPISNLQSPISFHFFDSVDDRYWCHYIGHSVFRALLLLENRSWDYQSQPVAGTTCPQPPTSSPPLPTETPKHRAPQAQPGSGHALLTSPAGATALVSTRKGAITTARWPDASTASDFGWIVQTPDKLLVSHWWSTVWTISIDDTRASCEGHLVPHKEHISAPWKHIALRIASFILGRRLIKLLKRLIIFKKPLRSHHFTRTVTWEDETLVIRDTITGLAESDTLTRAPRTSKRHVASADSFHPEDLVMLMGCMREERIERTGNVFECETRYVISDL